MSETEVLNILNISRSTFKEWSKTSSQKHKLYLLLKHIDEPFARKVTSKKVPIKIMSILNKNIASNMRFSDDDIFKLFSKKSYAKLTKKERVAFAKIVREADNKMISELLKVGVAKKNFLHLFNGSPFGLIEAFGKLKNSLTSLR